MIQRSYRFLLLGSAFLLTFGAPKLEAQYAKPPDAYYISYTESLMMPNQQVKMYRDGKQVVTEEFTPKSGPMANPTHTRASIDLETHKEWSVDLQDTSVPCSVGTLGGSPGDWSGNPFEWLSQFFDADLAKLHPPKVGTDTVAGMNATIFQVSAPDGSKAKIWVDDKYGLLLKMAAPGKNGKDETVLEVREFTAGKPSASALALSARCANQK